MAAGDSAGRAPSSARGRSRPEAVIVPSVDRLEPIRNLIDRMITLPAVKLPDTARFATVCIHAGQEPDPSTGAIITPIYQTSTYVQEELGKHKGYEYARTQNPTRSALEGNLAAIEGGQAAFAFASGMAAIGAIATLLKAGDHVIVTDNTYGGTFRLFDKVLTKYQLVASATWTRRSSTRSSGDPAATRMLFVETPTNPVMRLTDIAAAGRARARAGAPPRRRQHLREPLRPAAARPRRRPRHPQHDEVPQRPQRQRRRHRRRRRGTSTSSGCEFVQNAAGAILGPMDAWLVLRGTKTLAVRMAQHNVNGLALAEFLATHPQGAAASLPGPARSTRSTSSPSGRCAGSAAC